MESDNTKIEVTESGADITKGANEPAKKTEPQSQPVTESKADPSINALMEEIRKLKNKASESDKELSSLRDEVRVSKLSDAARKSGIDDKNITNLFAVIRGNGEEVTEESITKWAGNFPEWKAQAKGDGVTIGVGSGSSNEATADESKVKADFAERFNKA